MESKTYLVTGGAGFIGANFVKFILNEHPDDKVVIVDALTYAGNLLTIKDEIESPRVTFIKGDITDAELINSVFAEHTPDFVVNFAAESHVDRSISSPRVFLDTNIIGTQTMLEGARKAWLLPDGKYMPGKKYLQISTDEVYGSLPKDYDEPHHLELDEEMRALVQGRDNLICYGEEFFSEQSPLAPRSPYSASKTGADLIAQAYHSTYGLPLNITRCSNNYGPYHFPEKLIPLMIKNLLDGKDLPVYGKGENVRDWLYVTDHCRAIDLVLRKGRVGQVYNIGGFNEARNIDIVRMIIDIVAELTAHNPAYRALLANPEMPIDYSRIKSVTDRPGHDMRYAINPRKIATELGWYPRTPFPQGIRQTVKWYLDNPQWTESVTSGDYQNYYQRMYGSRQSKSLEQ